MKKFWIAVTVALITTLGMWVKLESDRKAAMSKTKMVSILKIKKYVPAGQSVLPEAVDEVQIPEAYVSSRALKSKSELLDPNGKPRYKARIGLPKSEFVTSAMLVEPSLYGGLSWTLEPGQLACTVKLNPEEAVAGLIQPGDFVNVMGFQKGVSKLVMEHVRVVAVGDRIWDSTDQHESDNSKPMTLDPVFVTLMGSQNDISLIHQAVMKGNVHLALVSLASDSISEGNEI